MGRTLEAGLPDRLSHGVSALNGAQKTSDATSAANVMRVKGAIPARRNAGKRARNTRRAWAAAVVGATIFGATSFDATPAMADGGRVGIDWGRLLLELDGYARSGSGTLGHTESNAYVATVTAPGRHAQPLVLADGNAWFGVAPSVSFVARDWGTAYRLSGDKLSLVDAMRLSESTRMVLTRVRLNRNNRITPFVQLGAGQWRTDRKFLPFRTGDTELAAQVGVGVELRLVGQWQLACETGATLFIRDRRESNDVPETRMWSAMIASRLPF